MKCVLPRPKSTAILANGLGANNGTGGANAIGGKKGATGGGGRRAGADRTLIGGA